MNAGFGCVLFAAATGFAQSPSHQAAIEAYRKALRTIEAHVPERHDLEAAFEAIAPLQEALVRSEAGRPSVLESLSDEEFQRLEGDLTGVLVNREEIVFVEPDPDFFVQLAVGHGDAADRTFFHALKATYPEGIWPVYVEQQTDYSGCTRFGSGKLVESYRLWTQFLGRYPTRYVAAAKKELDRVTGELTQSTCACEDTSSVERELRQFVRTFATSPVRAVADRRLRALRTGRSDVRPRCRSG
jgi:hypothetical protein